MSDHLLYLHSSAAPLHILSVVNISLICLVRFWFVMMFSSMFPSSVSLLHDETTVVLVLPFINV